MSQIITLILSSIAGLTLVVGAAIDSVIVGGIGFILLLVAIVLIIVGLVFWDWESGDSPGGMGGP